MSFDNDPEEGPIIGRIMGAIRAAHRELLGRYYEPDGVPLMVLCELGVIGGAYIGDPKLIGICLLGIPGLIGVTVRENYRWRDGLSIREMISEQLEELSERLPDRGGRRGDRGEDLDETPE